MDNFAHGLRYTQPYQGRSQDFPKGGGGGGDHTVSHAGYLHGPQQMFGPANGVCNYQALDRKDLWHVDSSDSRFFATRMIRFVCCLLEKSSH